MSDEEVWEALRVRVLACEKCEIRKGCKAPVFGVGFPDAKIMIVGEAPGATEDELGIPFVGMSGKLLDEILANVKLSREAVFITNVIKCCPPVNRPPKRVEIENCSTFLMLQIMTIKPRVVIALGAEAASVLLGKRVKVGESRGKVFQSWAGHVVPTWHPDYFLKTQSRQVKKEMERDIEKAMEVAKA